LTMTKKSKPPEETTFVNWYPSESSSYDRSMAPVPVDEDCRAWASPRTPTLKKGDLIQDKEHPDDFGLIVAVDESREDPYRVYVFNHIGEENRCYWMLQWYVEEGCVVVSEEQPSKGDVS